MRSRAAGRGIVRKYRVEILPCQPLVNPDKSFKDTFIGPTPNCILHKSPGVTAHNHRSLKVPLVDVTDHPRMDRHHEIRTMTQSVA